MENCFEIGPCLLDCLVCGNPPSSLDVRSPLLWRILDLLASSRGDDERARTVIMVFGPPP
eukprot:scaffold1270_cov252-Amphora_coffeaeformis.AAC.6